MMRFPKSEPTTQPSPHRRLHPGWRLLLGLAALATGATAQPAAPDAPLRISTNHRHLVDRQGTPFLLQGDAAWSLIANTTREETIAYLENRRAKGFNAIVVNLLEYFYSKNPPRDVYGEAPFTDPNDWTTTNEKYFAHADWVLRKAAEYGMTVLLFPAYLGYEGRPKGQEDGFVRELMASGPERALAYGRFLGKRYKDYDNLIWVMGGDRDPGPARESVDLIAYGIREHDQRHLFTAHCHSESSPAGQYPSPWLDFSNTYSYFLVHLALSWDYERKPVRPTLLFESVYEGEPQFASELQMRRQMYWSVLCGGFGHVMGNNPLWQFNPGWQAAMDGASSVAMMRWGKFFQSRPWAELVPDRDHKIVTAGLGELWGLDLAVTAATPDGSTIIAYTTSARTLTVDLTKMPKGQAVAWWFNPRTGEAVAAGAFATDGSKEFTPPGEGDWALVLDAAAKNLPPPGR